MIKVINILDNINPASGVTNVVYTFQPEMVKKIEYDFIYFHNSRKEKKLSGSKYLQLSLPKLVSKDQREIEKLVEFVGDSDVVFHNHVLLFSHLIMPTLNSLFPESRKVGHAHSSRLSNTPYKNIRNKILTIGIGKYYDEYWGCSTQALKCWFSNKKMKQKCSIVYNPVDCSLISKTRLNRSEKFHFDPLVIGHVGRLSPEKNHIFLLKIAKELSYKNIDFKMVFIGSGPNKNKLVSYTQKHNLDSRVEYISYLPKADLYKKMIEFDIFLFPSKFEGLGTALVEAQLLGIYSLANKTIPKETDLSNVSYLSLDVKQWVDKIMDFIQLKNMKEQNLDVSRCKYCLKMSSEDLLEKYESLLFNPI